MEKNSELPEGWIVSTISQVCKTSSGGTPSRRKKEYYGGSIPWIKSGELKDSLIFESTEKITELGMKESSAKLFPKETILLALYGANIGMTGLLKIDSTTNQAVCAIFNNKDILQTNFLFWYMRFMKKNLIKKAIGGAQPNISQTIVNKLEIVLPPLNEQKRIVKKIEELFLLISTTKNKLNFISKQLSSYNSTFFNEIFSGVITKTWREEFFTELKTTEQLKCDIFDKCKNMKKSLTDFNNTSILPESWVLCPLNYISTKIVDGTHKTPHYQQAGVIFLSAKNIFDHTIDFKNIKYISQSEYFELTKRCNPEYGDVLLTKSGTIGRTAIVPKNPAFSLFESVALIKPVSDFLHPEYLSHFLEFYVSKQSVMQTMKGVAVKHFHLEDIKKTMIPLPNLIEQIKIIEIIQQNHSQILSYKKLIKSQLEILTRLELSILKQAFEGKLVSQDSNDEPASELLKRIKNQ